jgi:hypothetical protein
MKLSVRVNENTKEEKKTIIQHALTHRTAKSIKTAHLGKCLWIEK